MRKYSTDVREVLQILGVYRFTWYKEHSASINIYTDRVFLNIKEPVLYFPFYIGKKKVKANACHWLTQKMPYG